MAEHPDGKQSASSFMNAKFLPFDKGKTDPLRGCATVSIMSNITKMKDIKINRVNTTQINFALMAKGCA